MIGNFPAILNLSWLFLKLNRFVCHHLSVLPDHWPVLCSLLHHPPPHQAYSKDHAHTPGSLRVLSTVGLSVFSTASSRLTPPSSDRGDFWAWSVEIRVLASPTGSMLTSSGFPFSREVLLVQCNSLLLMVTYVKFVGLLFVMGTYKFSWGAVIIFQFHFFLILYWINGPIKAT